MKTLGGYVIEDFQKLEEPIERNILEPHIYKGFVRNVPIYSEGETKFIDDTVTWDKFGRCSNIERTDCFILVNEIEDTV